MNIDLRTLALALTLSGVASSAALAQPQTAPTPVRSAEPTPKMCQLGDVRLENGATLRNVRMSYITLGALNPAKSNAILSIHGLRGTRNSQTSWAGPGKAFDTAKYFVVQPDTLGVTSLNSEATTSPTRSGLMMTFPRFTIRDMVALEYRLLTDCLGINHLVAVTGTSMGGMESMQWAVSYPDFMEAVIPMVPQARASRQAQAVWTLARRAIALDPKWKDGAYAADDPPRAGAALGTGVQNLFGSSSEAMQSRPAPGPAPAPRPAGAPPATEAGPPGGGVDARDWYYRTLAIETHDISNTPEFKGDLPAAAKTIKARLLLFPNCRDQLLAPTEGGVFEVAKAAPKAKVIDINDRQGHGGTTTPTSEALITAEVRDLLSRIEQGKSGIKGSRFQRGRKLDNYCAG